jgi:hypothetical protein
MIFKLDNPLMGVYSTKFNALAGVQVFLLSSLCKIKGGLLAPLCGARDPQTGTPSTKSPARLRCSLVFFIYFPQHCKHASVRKQKIPFLRYAQEEDFVEVGGGFEPPYPVLQTDA